MSEITIPNADQAEAWNGQEGEHWARHQYRYDTLTGAFSAVLLDNAAIAPTDRVLDVGCGCGMTTRLAAQRASRGEVVGVDLSEPMLERARADAAAEGLANVRFEQGDAQVFPFPAGRFDVALSSFGVMFFADPAAAFRNIARSLRAGGRLVFVCWQELAENEWLTVPASGALAYVPMPDLGSPDDPGGLSLASPERITEILAGAGFEDIHIAPVEASMRMGDDADDAVSFIRGTSMAHILFDGVDQAAVRRALDAIREALRPYEQAGGLTLRGAAWLVTAQWP